MALTIDFNFESHINITVRISDAVRIIIGRTLIDPEEEHLVTGCFSTLRLHNIIMSRIFRHPRIFLDACESQLVKSNCTFLGYTYFLRLAICFLEFMLGILALIFLNVELVFTFSNINRSILNDTSVCSIFLCKSLGKSKMHLTILVIT